MFVNSVDLSPDLGKIDINEWFMSPENPLHIDIGCARGRCIERLSSRCTSFPSVKPFKIVLIDVLVRPERSEWNHLGVEIRPTVVQQAMERINEKRANGLKSDEIANGHRNIHFLACNFVASVDDILSAFPRGIVRNISIQVQSLVMFLIIC